ncbi:hypothetical protein ZIOFF_066236 [Zingiber officinale]|uniref:Uncharacterized protein n=1 Tax=Zingiber officinale TaxID=94328 RepID=A0A8J5KBZ8_ZINOF|nr:hypothetical protein ZIOFF_066236 [Zingiber officinale]
MKGGGVFLLGSSATTRVMHVDVTFATSDTIDSPLPLLPLPRSSEPRRLACVRAFVPATPNLLSISSIPNPSLFHPTFLSRSFSHSMADPSSQDVDEFVWVEEADMGIPLEKFSEVFNLLRRGNRAFREKRFEEAISYYSKALPLKPQDPVILGNRSAAFCRTSQLLKDRSARDSEYQPLNGLDPTTHAELPYQLALKDAEKVIRVHCTSPKAYFLKANALVLLEQYEEARETILSGLQIDPMSNLLQTYLQEIDRVVAGSVKRVKHWKPERTDDLECTLCFKLLYEPVTTPCGHSFCRSCLHQSMDHGNKCPMCRRVLFISPRTYPISVTLNNIIQKSFPEEYAERKSEQESLTHLGVDIMPLFVMDVVLPCQKISLNIFEPRYRLMVRRIMEGNRRMGMVAVDPATGSIADFACEVEILECEPLPDGRFYLEGLLLALFSFFLLFRYCALKLCFMHFGRRTKAIPYPTIVGSRWVKAISFMNNCRYRVAEVEWIWDTLPPKDSQEKEDVSMTQLLMCVLICNLMQMTIEAAELTKAWFKRARESMRIGRRSRQLEHFEAEGVPKLDNPERFSFWLINLLNIRPSERLELLRLQDTSKRISHGLISLQAEEQGCRVQ